MGFILPWMNNQHEHFAKDAGVPDLSFIYQPEDLFRMADSYGEEGRREYVNSRLTFDLIFPIAYTYFNVTTLGFVLNQGMLGGRKMKILLLLPIMAMIFDLLENTFSSLVMLTHPERILWISQSGVYATMMKWIFVGLAFGLALISLVLTVLRAIRNSNK